MNRPGGLGHIEKVYTTTTNASSSTARTTNDSIPEVDDSADTTTNAASAVVDEFVTHVDVKYLQSELATRDRGIPIQYVSDHHHIAMEIMGGNVGARCGATRRHRRNKINSRRCTECGSFAIDCGNCDWRNEELRIAIRKRREAEGVELEQQRMERYQQQHNRAIDGRSNEKKRTRLIRRYVSGDISSNDDSGNSSSSSSSSGNTSDEDAIDSEEEEIRRVKTMNRHRKRNGQIVRQRRRIGRARRWNQTNEQGPDNESSEDDDDEVPLAILQRRIEQSRKARDRKLRDMKLMMNRQVQQLTKKRKKMSHRTRPQNACALMDIANQTTRKGIDSDQTMEVNTNTNNQEEFYETTKMSGDVSGAPTFDNELGNSSDDDDLVTFGDLRNQATLSSDVAVGRNAAQDDSVDELLTPREFSDDDDELNDEENDGGSGSECYDSPNQPIELLDCGDDFDGGASERGIRVRELNWGDLPNFINELCNEIHNQRIVHVQNALNAMKRKLQATKRGVSRTSSLQASKMSQELIETLTKLSEERCVEYIVSCFFSPVLPN
jgi:hypothetical protein